MLRYDPNQPIGILAKIANRRGDFGRDLALMGRRAGGLTLSALGRQAPEG